MIESPLCFINYRRSDSGGHVAHLKDELERWYDSSHLFYDNQTVDYGADFPHAIEQAIEHANVLLAVIGPDWLAALREYQATNKADWVKREILAALFRGRYGKPLPIIPILVGGATMPKTGDLPAELADFALLHSKNALSLGSDSEAFDTQFQALLALLEQHGLPTRRFRPPKGTARPFHALGRLPSANFHDPLAHLQHLHEVLSSAGTAAVLAGALHGMGGVGKTQLALKYSHTFQENYAGVWWLRAEDRVMLELDCMAMAEANRIPYEKGQPIAPAIQRWLATQPTWLLVYDNAEDMAMVSSYLPNRGQHHVLITSRRPDWQRLTGATACIHLEHWTPEQALSFLTKRLPKENPDALLQIAIALGGLPLALEQAAAYIDASGVSAEEYCQLLADSAQQATLLDKTAEADERSVLKTLSLALGKLSSAARQLLNLCAVCAPAAIPENLFQKHCDVLPEILKASCNGLDWVDMVKQLRRYALVERDANQLTMTLHRLTQAAVRRSTPETNVNAITIMCLLDEDFPLATKLPENWPRCAVLLPHIKNLMQFKTYLSDVGTTHYRLLDLAARYLQYGPTLYAESCQLSMEALELSVAVHGENHLGPLTVKSGLALTFSAQGNFVGAQELQQQLFESFKKMFGINNLHTITSMNNLAETYREQGNLPEAKKILLRAVDASQLTLGREHPITLASMENLVKTLISGGDFAAAKVLHVNTLNTRKEVLGTTHPDTLSSMTILAEIHRKQGSFDEAKELQLQTLDIYKQTSGLEHPRTLTAMMNLSVTLCDLGNFEAAKQIQINLLNIQQRVLGCDHPSTLLTMNNLAETLRNLTDLAGAKEMQLQTMDSYKRVLGSEHPMTISSMSNLALTLYAMADFSGAKILQIQVMTVFTKTLGQEHPNTLTSMSNLALTLCDQGDLTAAKPLQEKILNIFNRVAGEEHPNTTVAAWNLFCTLTELGESNEAQDVLTRHLMWLLSRPIHTLGNHQHAIRVALADALNVQK